MALTPGAGKHRDAAGNWVWDTGKEDVWDSQSGENMKAGQVFKDAFGNMVTADQAGSDVSNFLADIVPGEKRTEYLMKRQHDLDEKYGPQIDYSGADANAANPNDRSLGWQDRMSAAYDAAGNRNNHQADYGAANQARGMQMGLLQDVLNSSRGGPSIAQAQLQKATDQNIAQTRALAASQRGLGHSAAQRQVAAQAGQQRQQMSADSGILRLQEQMQNRELAAKLGQGIREQDIGQASALAGFNIASAGLNDAQMRGMAELGQKAAAGDRDAKMALEQLKAQIIMAQNNNRMGLGNLASANAGQRANVAGANADRNVGILKQGIDTAGNIAAAIAQINSKKD